MQHLRPFVLERPQSLSEATHLLASDPGARILAGGTDLMPNLRRGIGLPTRLIDLGGVHDFSTIDFGARDGEALSIGAGATLTSLATHPKVMRDYPAIAQAAGSIAGPGHRNAATLGGNLCVDTRCVFYNQGEWWRAANDHCLKLGGTVCHVAPQGHRCHAAFSGDLAPALLALGAEVELANDRGSRSIPLEDLYRDDGAEFLAIARDEILVRAIVPVSSSTAQGCHSAYRKARARESTDFPLAGVACALTIDAGRIGQCRIAITGTNPRPFVLAGTDSLINGPFEPGRIAEIGKLVGKLVQKQVAPMRTTVTPSHYRRLVAAVLAQRLLVELAELAEAD